MNVYITVVGEHSGRAVTWPEDWPVPSLGSEIELQDGLTLWVRTVAWNPHSSQDDDPTNTGAPFIYIVVGPKRPEW